MRAAAFDQQLHRRILQQSCKAVAYKCCKAANNSATCACTTLPADIYEQLQSANVRFQTHTQNLGSNTVQFINADAANCNSNLHINAPQQR